LKAKKGNITIRELFRKKLEYAEVIPDVSVKTDLMRRVARQEFLRFNPGSFNIFYLGGILLAGIAASLLIFSDTDSQKQVNLIPNSPDTFAVFDVPAGNALVTSPDTIYKLHSENIVNILTKPLSVDTNTNTKKLTISPRNLNSAPHSVSNTISGKNIFSAVPGKLRVTKKSGESFIEVLNTTGCAPFKVKFSNKLSSFDSCRWSFGDGGSSTQKDPEWIFDVEGEYKIGLEVFGEDAKVLSSTATITVHAHPQAHFEISPENAEIPEDEIRFRNYSTNASRFRWDFGDGHSSDFFEPEHTYSKYSNYNVKLIVWSDWGCSDSLTVINAFSGSHFYLDFPNAFIPNPQGPTGGYYSSKSDEAAQVFHPSFSGITEYQLKIFSKLGIPIFESYDVNLGWDGYNKGQLCDPGVYIWKVRGKFRNGEPFIKMGDVTLLQN
jgi:PKD repeat protein